MIPEPVRKPDTVEWLFLDVGDTMIYLNVDHIAEHLQQFGYDITGPELLQAQARTRPLVDQAVLERREAHLRAAADGEGGSGELLHENDEAFLRWIGAILRIADPRIDSPTRREAVLSLRTADTDATLWARVDPHLVPTLETLRARGVQLGVISNATGKVEEQLTEAGLRPYFETVVDSFVVGIEKPDPAIFHLAMDRVGARPASTIYVGDFYSFDVVGANSAGLFCALMDPSETYRANYPHVTALSSVRELPALLGLG